MAAPRAGGAAGARGRAHLARLLAAAVVTLSAAPAAGKCLMKQAQGDITPSPTLPNETAPFPLAANTACPQYQASGCCTPFQDETLFVNFLAIRSAFGIIADGGCPGCLYNVEAFWCAYTCSPHQEDFLTPVGFTEKPDPNQGGKLTPVFETRARVHQNMTCATFDSCAKTKTVSETADLQTGEGFFEFQGQDQAVGHGAYIDFDFVTDGQPGAAGAINVPTSSCCNWMVNPKAPALGNSSCPCAYCQGMCPGHGSSACAAAAPSGLGDLDTPWWSGFDVGTAGAVWGGTLLAVAVVTWWRGGYSTGFLFGGGAGTKRGKGGAGGAGAGGEAYLALPSK
jgi:hypothetical protein